MSSRAVLRNEGAGKRPAANVVKSSDDTLDRLSQRLLAADDQAGGARRLVAFLALTACLLAVRFAIGSCPVTLFPDDAMNALAQGDYLARGSRPYVDYYSLHGPFAFLFIALGIEAYGISLDAIVLGQLVAAAIFGTFTWKVATSRLNGFWAIVLALSVELLIVTCTPIGRRSWREFSPAMWYNTINFSLTAILFLYVLLPSRSTSALSRWLDALIAAGCLTAAFYTKMSFFPPLALVFLAGTVLLPRGDAMRAHGLAALALTAALIFALAWALDGSVAGYVGFLQSVALKIHPLAFALRFLQYTRTVSMLALAMGVIAWMAYDAGVLRQTGREWVIAFLMCGAWMVMASTCKQDPEALPLIGVLPLAIAAAVAARARHENARINPRLAIPGMAVALILIVADAKNSALSLPFSQMTITTLEPPVERLGDASVDTAEVMISRRVDRRLLTMLPRTWVEHVLAALALLQEANATPGDVLFVSTEANGVTVLTDLKHTRGESPWAAYALAENPTDVPPSVDNFVGDADLILRDLKDPGSWENLRHFRGEYVEKHFVRAAQNDDWILYRRSSTPAAAGATSNDGAP